MNRQSQTVLDGTMLSIRDKLRATDLERVGILYARWAVGAAFLSAVASLFGLWDGTLDLKHFANFINYTAEVNSFLPKVVIPSVAILATVCETLFGILLILGAWLRWVSLGSASCSPHLELRWQYRSGSSRQWTIRSFLPQVRRLCWRSMLSAGRDHLQDN